MLGGAGVASGAVCGDITGAVVIGHNVRGGTAANAGAAGSMSKIIITGTGDIAPLVPKVRLWERTSFGATPLRGWAVALMLPTPHREAQLPLDARVPTPSVWERRGKKEPAHRDGLRIRPDGLWRFAGCNDLLHKKRRGA